jgi:hypothetical protein
MTNEKLELGYAVNNTNRIIGKSITDIDDMNYLTKDNECMSADEIKIDNLENITLRFESGNVTIEIEDLIMYGSINISSICEENLLKSKLVKKSVDSLFEQQKKEASEDFKKYILEYLDKVHKNNIKFFKEL